MFNEVFSPTEQKVMSIINRHRSINTKEIAKQFYGRKKKPKHFRVVISNAINRINSKCIKHKLEYKLEVTNFGCKGKSITKVWVP